MSPLLAHSRHGLVHCTCPLSGVKPTSASALHRSAFDPKRTYLAAVSATFQCPGLSRSGFVLGGGVMKRRDFIKAIVSSAAATWPFATRAQQLAMPVIGFLHSGSPGPYQHLVAAFHQGLKETGYVDGQSVIIEFRWADGHFDRLPAL